MHPTRGSARRKAARGGVASATVLGLCALGALPPPAAAEFECRIKKMVTSGKYLLDHAGMIWHRGESYPGHIYATVASTDCATDAAGPNPPEFEVTQVQLREGEEFPKLPKESADLIVSCMHMHWVNDSPANPNPHPHPHPHPHPNPNPSPNPHR